MALGTREVASRARSTTRKVGGHRAKYIEQRRKEVLTVVGRVSVARTYYYRTNVLIANSAK